MSKILKVSQSNYRLQTQSGGTITLDTGTSAGTVVVTGNLNVKGTTTTVESTNTTVTDNILQLNFGQTGNGISSALSYQAGVEIVRGNYSNAQLLFNEQLTYYSSVSTSNVSGTFVLKTADTALKGLRVATIGNDGSTDFVIDMQSGSKAILVGNSPNYDTYVANDNHLVTKKWTTSYVVATSGMAVVDKLYFYSGGTYTSSTSPTLIQAYASNIQFSINQVLKATISSTGLLVNNVNINSDTISNPTNNLILTATNNNVEVNAVLNIDDQITTPTSTVGKTKMYSSATIGPGRSGVYFTNNTITTADELISRNRAVLLSILL
jgi:hypothetical protein